MGDKKEVVVLGAGPAGLAAAKEISKNKSSRVQVTVMDMGREAEKRYCPERDDKKCIGCNPCNKLYGAGGAGLMSDGKCLFHTKIGNNLEEIMEMPENRRLVGEVEKFFSEYGINELRGKSQEIEDLERRALNNEIDFIYPRQTHIGSDRLPKFIAQVQADLEKAGVKFEYGRKLNSLDEIKYDFVILAPGRVGIGTGWMETVLKKEELEYTFRPVDVGVRIEVPHQIADQITNVTRDLKFYIRTKCNDDAVRTFCTCPSGHVVRERYGNFNIVNGEASESVEKHSGNTNFAILVTIPLTEPLANPNIAAKLVAESFYEYSGGKIMAQRFGDTQKRPAGRSKEYNRGNYVLQPTLKDVTWGDIRLPMGGRYWEDIEEMIIRLNSVMPGVASGQTILYAPEIKFHGLRIKTDEYLHAGKGIYVAGDGSGMSRGIVGAMASGIRAAEGILRHL